jgi:PadR family transcriptional regulator, regulatory protein PadR
MRLDAVRGHVEGMLLGVLEAGPLHGYAVIEALSRRSNGAVDLPSGTVYPALHRLERMGLIASENQVVGGRRRRCYVLTEAGHRRLRQERTDWRTFTVAVGAVLNGGPA